MYAVTRFAPLTLYDTPSYYMRWKADVSQLNLPHGTENKNIKIGTETKNKTGYAQKKRSSRESGESVSFYNMHHS